MNQLNTNSVSNDTSMWTPTSETWNMEKIDHHHVLSNSKNNMPKNTIDNYDNILLSKGRLAVNNQPKDSHLGMYDILCGRGRASWNNCGNKKFRVLINLNMQRYMDAGTNKQEKSKIIHSIYDMIQKDMGGRFFKQQGKKELIELCRKECHVKIGHALRDLVALQQQSTRSSSSASSSSASSVSTSSFSSVSSMSSTSSSSSWCGSDEEREISHSMLTKNHDITFSDRMDLSKLTLEPIGDSFFDRSSMIIDSKTFVDPFC